MKTGAAIALGIGGVLLLSRQQAAAQQAANASSPVAAAANGLAALESSLFKSLANLATPKPKGSSGGSGFNPAGGAGSGRSAGGTTPVISVEDAFPNFNGPNVIPTGPTGAAFEPGGIFSDPSQFAGNEFDLSTSPPPDPTAENSLIDSLAQESSGVPIFDPGAVDTGAFDPNAVDPSVPVPIDPSIDAISANDFTDGGF